jgi:hypothetical protein
MTAGKGRSLAVARARARARVRASDRVVSKAGRLAGGDYQRGSKPRGIDKGDIFRDVNVLSSHPKNLGVVNIPLFMGLVM